MPVRNAYRWDYIKIELVIDGRIRDSRMITLGAYFWTYRLFKSVALSQKKEWAIFINYQRNYKTIRNQKLFDILLNRTETKEELLQSL